MQDIFTIHCRNYASGYYTFEQFLSIVSDIYKLIPSNLNNFYMGEFSNNHLNGKGMQIYPSGHIYTGIFANSKKEGIGKLINPDGTIHDGKFKDDLFIGK